MDNFRDAAAMYRKAIDLKEDDFEIMFNAANAHRQAGLNNDAEKLYWKAVLLKPEVSEGRPLHNVFVHYTDQQENPLTDLKK